MIVIMDYAPRNGMVHGVIEDVVSVDVQDDGRVMKFQWWLGHDRDRVRFHVLNPGERVYVYMNHGGGPPFVTYSVDDVGLSIRHNKEARL